ncbi:unnamed protein product [Amoebophrya sp. A120]|nr:unnamed protein product [Amoebophrya sp. A120]|eukprot:GSA120T00001352001.1
MSAKIMPVVKHLALLGVAHAGQQHQDFIFDAFRDKVDAFVEHVKQNPTNIAAAVKASTGDETSTAEGFFLEQASEDQDASTTTAPSKMVLWDQGAVPDDDGWYPSIRNLVIEDKETGHKHSNLISSIPWPRDPSSTTSSTPQETTTQQLAVLSREIARYHAVSYFAARWLEAALHAGDVEMLKSRGILSPEWKAGVYLQSDEFACKKKLVDALLRTSTLTISTSEDEQEDQEQSEREKIAGDEVLVALDEYKTCMGHVEEKKQLAASGKWDCSAGVIFDQKLLKDIFAVLRFEKIDEEYGLLEWINQLDPTEWLQSMMTSLRRNDMVSDLLAVGIVDNYTKVVAGDVEPAAQDEDVEQLENSEMIDTMLDTQPHVLTADADVEGAAFAEQLRAEWKDFSLEKILNADKARTSSAASAMFHYALVLHSIGEQLGGAKSRGRGLLRDVVDHFTKLRPALNLMDTPSAFEAVKLWSVEPAMKTWAEHNFEWGAKPVEAEEAGGDEGTEQTEDFREGMSLNLTLRLNILEATLQDQVNENHLNVIAGQDMVESQNVNWAALASFQRLYESWNLAFVTGNFREAPLFWSKLLTPIVGGATPGSYMFHRILALYIHWHTIMCLRHDGRTKLRALAQRESPLREKFVKKYQEVVKSGHAAPIDDAVVDLFAPEGYRLGNVTRTLFGRRTQGYALGDGVKALARRATGAEDPVRQAIKGKLYEMIADHTSTTTTNNSSTSTSTSSAVVQREIPALEHVSGFPESPFLEAFLKMQMVPWNQNKDVLGAWGALNAAFSQKVRGLMTDKGVDTEHGVPAWHRHRVVAQRLIAAIGRARQARKGLVGRFLPNKRQRGATHS